MSITLSSILITTLTVSRKRGRSSEPSELRCAAMLMLAKLQTATSSLLVFNSISVQRFEFNSNLCTEIELNTRSDEVAVCNLASINIAAHLSSDGSLDLPRLRETVNVVMRMLDNVIDINFYPV